MILIQFQVKSENYIQISRQSVKHMENLKTKIEGFTDSTIGANRFTRLTH